MDRACFTPVPLIGIEIFELDTLVRMMIAPARLPAAVGAKIISIARLFPAPIVRGKLNLLLTKALLAMYASERVMAALPVFLIVRPCVIEAPR